MSELKQIETIEQWRNEPEEFKEACRKIVISHAINELYGSRVYDEPAISMAPDPYAKWQVCRVVMEEYGHHYRFFELGREMGIEESLMLPDQTEKSPLSIMGYNMTTWEEFCVIKMLGDLAEIIQVEDLVQCSFHPLRNLARMTMPEEHFHAEFGENFTTDICERDGGKELIQEHINTIFPLLPSFFGRSGSKNNEIYRKWGIKKCTNEEMRANYVKRADAIVSKLGLSLPEVDLSAY
ncbi:MAG: phenylacetic acid catabolic family protein [Rhodospirillaceae bacterium]|jgi:ring-1,2-phenylacetyl-CoA epoxidase subunit PaaA|nr:phenylacetic acid catabolic family protein [Rhodospirillaceae bacterium]MBT4590381.1 phenylacetic acid catabolic family protein [Rhodospirillaceae bacterium]MBT4941180.1 phenylacetic acid catabolic family protein [Rhodospirillaceae bacterium]MBT5938660.1 phenylacetic acid catabolic family protein [Rhodospirillaceae bacterium]MBT7267113.1 phenylacetic acid catabolic family protein [Rhodospirillaceae bacterium]